MERETSPSAPGLLGRLLSLAGRAVRPFERAARRVLGPDGDLKVLAAAGAIVLYLLVRPAAAGIERTVSVPVTVTAASQTTTAVGTEPSSVSVTLRGTAEDFTAFDQDALRIELRPTPEENALYGDLPIGPKDVTNGIDRLRVVSVEPSSVRVAYDFMSKIMTTNFVAKPRLLGRPIQGVASVSIPTNLAVPVYGSVTKLGAFSAKGIRLPTDPIDVEGKTESFDVDVAIRPPEDSGITSVEPAEVKAHVEIRTRAAADAGEIHVSAPILLKSEEEEPAKAAPAEPEPPATNAVPSSEPEPAPDLVDVGSVPPGGDPFPDDDSH